MSTLLLPVCTFGRVFDTEPLSEVLTLPELTAALRRFELKPQTMAKVERELARIRQAVERTNAGEAPRGKYMGKLAKAAEKARREGRDPKEAVLALAEQLEEEAVKSAKRDLRLWSPALYRPGATKRGRENVTHVSCLVLDYDDGTPIADASVTWSAFFHIVHTTWSHTGGHPKFRLVIPLAFPVPAEDWGKVWSWAEERAHFEIDPAMKSPAATYALPALPHRAWPHQAFSRPGAILDPVDEGILTRRTRLALSPRKPPPGVFSVIRGEDPEHEYVDYEDPEAVYFVDEWDEPWEPPEEVVAEVERETPAPLRAAAALPAEELEKKEGEGAREEPAGKVEPEEAKRAEREASMAARGESAEVERQLVERLEAAIARLEALASGSAVVDALERLVALHERGWLSKDELSEAKRRVLDASEIAEGALRRVGPGAHRKTLAVDFDGVIHSYTSGWQGALVIPDPPVEGAIAWLEAAAEQFDLAIFSVRAQAPGAVDAMRAWLRAQGLSERVLERIRFPSGKPPAELYIDDRGYRFEGRFPSLDTLARLEPWTRKRR